MYTFSQDEFDVLAAAVNGALSPGTPEYESALQVYIDAYPGNQISAESNFWGIVDQNTGKPYALFYDLAAEFASISGSTEDSNVITWLNGAAGVNRGDTIASDFIRDYTAAQVAARTGEVIDSNTLQDASDDIARRVYADISGPGHTLPSINRIGQSDVGGTIDQLGSGNPAIWSGNILFPGLGDSSFFYANIIETPGDTYDLLTAAYSVSQAGYGAFLGAGLSSVWTLFSNRNSAIDTANAAADFINEAYGGTGLIAPLFMLATTNIVVGQEFNGDTLAGGDADELIHGGGGDDIITGSRGTDIIDGGLDFDAIDYSDLAVPAGFDFFLYSDDDVAANFVGTTILDGFFIDILFNIESIVGSDLADTFHVRDDFSNGMLIDGAGNGADNSGDTLDLSTVSEDATVDLQGNALNIGSNSIDIHNTENVVGSSSNDTIKGNDEKNLIDGREGNDEIDGGAGNDIIKGGAGDDILQGGPLEDDNGNKAADRIEGGSGDDVITLAAGEAYGQQGNDTITILGDVSNGSDGTEAAVQAFGGTGNDMLDARGSTGSHILSGGSGDDTIYGNGNSILVAGSGKDAVYALTGDTMGDRLTADDALFVNGVEISGTLPSEGQDTTLPPAEGSGFFWGFKWPDQKFVVTRELQQGVANYGFAVFLEMNSSNQPDFNGTLSSVSYTAYIVTDFSGFTLEEYWGTQITTVSSQIVKDRAFVISDFRPGDFGLMQPIEVEEYTDESTFVGSFKFFYDNYADTEYHRYSWDRTKINGEWVFSDSLDIGEPTPYSEEALREEAEFEYLTEAFSDEALAALQDGPSAVSTEGSDLLTGTGSSTFGGGGDDIIILSSAHDTASGGDDDDFIVGLGGNDTLSGDAGNDRIFGDDAPGTQLFTTFDGFGEAPPVDGDAPPIDIDVPPIDGDAPPLTGGGTSPDGPPTSDDDALFGGSGDDTIYGGRGDDLIEGNQDNDLLFGEGGNDTVSGGEGSDLLEGGEGDDILSGDGGDDEVFGNKGNDDLSGGYGDDIVSGGDGNDHLSGDGGADTLLGGKGDDVILGGSGDDTIVYTSGNDVISGYRAVNYGFDTLDLSKYTADQVSFRIAGHDVFIDTPDGTIELEYQLRYEVGHSRSNIESILFSDGTLDEAGIAGRAIADQGTPGDDVITGSFQDDIIAGGAGNDILSGINGSDTFVFAVGDGVDHITDYNPANDMLEFTGISFTDLTITQVASDVVIEYGTGDQVVVENSVIANFDEPEFLFA